MSKYELYYQTALAQYQRQFGQSTGFDARATAMLAVAATLAGIGAVILKDFSGQATFSVWTAVVTGLVAITFIVAAGSAISGLRPRPWHVSPNPNVLAEHLHSPEYEESGLTEWVGDELARSVAQNAKVIMAKGKAVSTAAGCVAVMTVLVIVLAVVVNV